MKKSMVFSVLLLVVSLCVSCSFVEQNETGANLAVKYAALKLIDQDEAKAEKVCSITNDAQTFFDSQQLPITEIEELIRGKIDFKKLDPADALLAETLIAVVVEKINEGAADGVLDKELMVTASKVLGWVKSVSC